MPSRPPEKLVKAASSNVLIYRGFASQVKTLPHRIDAGGPGVQACGHDLARRAYRVSFQRPAAPTTPMPQTSAAPQSFEAALAELEDIVTRMEGGALPLAESLAAYKRGAELLQYCQGALKDAQLQVEVLERGVLKAFKPEDEGDAR